MKERLVNLLLSCDKENDILSCYHERPRKFQAAEIIANYLLENKIIVPPCLSGDTIYYIDKDKNIQEAQVNSIIVTGGNHNIVASRYIWETEDTIRLYFVFDDLDRRFWLAKEKAEEALKKIESNGK